MRRAGGHISHMAARRAAGLAVLLALAANAASPAASGAAAPSSSSLQLPAAPTEEPSGGPPVAPTAGAATQSRRTAVITRLTNEVKVTAWAHPRRQAPIFMYPNPHSARVGHTDMLTEDGFPEVYELLRMLSESGGGRTWIEIRIPGRPNGRRGWVEAAALGAIHRTHWRIVVSLRARRLVAYFDGRVQMVAPVGVGKPASPTPPGHFWIRERFRISDRSNPYWPYALGTSDYSTLTDWPGGGVVGIHGDFGEPEKIPGDPSHGCVRMRDSDLARLAPRVSLGTPVDIV